jgi:hypothetical protein
VRRNFIVRAIFVGYRRLSRDDLDNFLTGVVTQNQLAATCMSASRRGAQGESVKSKKSCTEKYAEWNPVPKNMQSCTPEKCLPFVVAPSVYTCDV